MSQLTHAARRLTRLARHTDGATMVEYALLVALIAVVVIVAVQALGTTSSSTLTNASNAIGS